MEIILTGKCEKDFQKWFSKNVSEDISFLIGEGFDNSIDVFEELTSSMQYGVLEDFFDSIGIEIMFNKEDADTWFITLYNEDTLIEDTISGDIYSRQEARQQAIIKANEIYND